MNVKFIITLIPFLVSTMAVAGNTPPAPIPGASSKPFVNNSFHPTSKATPPAHPPVAPRH